MMTSFVDGRRTIGAKKSAPRQAVSVEHVGFQLWSGDRPATRRRVQTSSLDAIIGNLLLVRVRQEE
jgi:hypothetical protein